jgi:hypothetical protein
VGDFQQRQEAVPANGTFDTTGKSTFFVQLPPSFVPKNNKDWVPQDLLPALLSCGGAGFQPAEMPAGSKPALLALFMVRDVHECKEGILRRPAWVVLELCRRLCPRPQSAQ